MEEGINVLSLNDEQRQALVCMFFAMLPGSDPRYKKRTNYWKILGKRFNKEINTYKYAKDTYDRYFANNNREGWKDDRPLSRRGREYQEVFDMYRDYPEDIIEQAVEDIMSLYMNTYISMKCGLSGIVHPMLREEKYIVIDGVYTLQEELILDKIVFVTLGGDRGKKEVDWEPGFFGIAHIVKEPYDFGYNGKSKYFKFDICMDCSFGRTYKREDFINYRDAFDARYIGPELTRDPSQAISGLEEEKAVAVIRTVLDQQPELEDDFAKIFPWEFMDRVKGPIRMLIPTVAEYGEKDEKESEIFQERKKISGKYCEKSIHFETGLNKGKFARNRIIFGAPGTGKSYLLNKDKDELIVDSKDYERVTFHPNFSYGNFVGCYKPVSKKDKQDNENIVYEYVPGPFMRILVKALENSRNEIGQVKPFLLLIEEINRANVAAVFGEVFQLLDRNSRNVSEYSIKPSEDIKKYLMNAIHVSEEEINELRIPDNMYIWATMNSADQGVFPMDTAFKRRWEFEYVGIDHQAEKVEDYIIPIGDADHRKYVRWNDLRIRINQILSSDECRVNEDKLLGPFFISKNVLKNALIDADMEKQFVKAFESKVIMYLFEDVMKMRPKSIFKGHEGRMIFSEICRDFEMNGEKVFGIEGLESVDMSMVE